MIELADGVYDFGNVTVSVAVMLTSKNSGGVIDWLLVIQLEGPRSIVRGLDFSLGGATSWS